MLKAPVDERIRKSERFRTDEAATKISLPRLHRISPLRCIVVLVDAGKFRQNATKGVVVIAGARNPSGNAESTRCGVLVNAARA
ncbi:hypothetical protein PLANPX_4307 [Lacipirellula parvula]|uniref:Uncharacterized protein n=1 Tax=Lacipirellula parvula TaxID=2650471 RepID=A0A5K7XE77_9BACT|nr:hypothetical protein PLANPX_4307 [Lacipirellula parvula]